MKCRKKKKEQFCKLSEEVNQLNQQQQILQWQVGQFVNAFSGRPFDRYALQTIISNYENGRNIGFSTYEGSPSNNGQIMSFQSLQGHQNLPNMSFINQEVPLNSSMYPNGYQTLFNEPSIQQGYTGKF